MFERIVAEEPEPLPGEPSEEYFDCDDDPLARQESIQSLGELASSLVQGKRVIRRVGNASILFHPGDGYIVEVVSFEHEQENLARLSKPQQKTLSDDSRVASVGIRNGESSDYVIRRGADGLEVIRHIPLEDGNYIEGAVSEDGVQDLHSFLSKFLPQKIHAD